MSTVLLVLQILLLQQRYTWARVTSSNHATRAQVSDAPNDNKNTLNCDADVVAEMEVKAAKDIEMV